jgi:hypothetical protein
MGLLCVVPLGTVIDCPLAGIASDPAASNPTIAVMRSSARVAVDTFPCKGKAWDEDAVSDVGMRVAGTGETHPLNGFSLRSPLEGEEALKQREFFKRRYSNACLLACLLACVSMEIVCRMSGMAQWRYMVFPLMACLFS